MLQRLPLASSRPVVVFGIVRVALTAAAFLLVLVLNLPDREGMLLVIGGAALPWAVLLLVAATRDPDAAMNPAVAGGDFALLVLLEAVAPDSYAAVRFAALFLVAAHAYFQGDRRGVAVAVLGATALVVPSAIAGDEPASGALLAFYEGVFVLTAVATGLLVGRLRTQESASRLRARGISRRMIQEETEIRRRFADAIHDGPVQELIGLDMVLSTVGQAVETGQPERATELLEEARRVTAHNVQVLRDEIVGLGPYAFEELSYSTAVENCIPIWNRHYGLEVLATIESVELPPEMAGDLFRITKEAVVNAGRHAEADTVSISLRRVGDEVELRVADNGEGFGATDPLGPAEPGHLGLAGMRERAELMDGHLEIDTTEQGSKVLVRAPLPASPAL